MPTIKTLLALHLALLAPSTHGAASESALTLNKDEAQVVHIKPNLVIDHNTFLFFDGKTFDGHNVRLSSSDEAPPAGTAFEYGTQEEGKVICVNFTEHGLKKVKERPLEQISVQIPVTLIDTEPTGTTPVGHITIESMEEIRVITSVLPGSSPPLCTEERVMGHRIQLSIPTKILALLKVCQQKELTISANITKDEAQMFDDL